MPLSNSNIYYSNYDADTFNQGRKEEIMWLNSTNAWSEYHSEREAETDVSHYPGQHALKPLIGEKVNTLNGQYHCMKIIKEDTNFINPNQKPVDVSDQPVYALSVEVQLRYPETFGFDKYICLLVIGRRPKGSL